MTPELRWLRSFLAVAEEQHFSRAARRLNLAQPALTAHIQQLEAALGFTLFERTNRMGGLTAAGRALLPEAEAIVNRAEALERKVREVAHGEKGLLRLGVIPPAATSAAADSLRSLAQELPGVEVQVRQGDQAHLENLLLDGDLDLMLGRPPENKSLAHRRLFVEQQGVLIRADDPLAKSEVLPLRQAQEEWQELPVAIPDLALVGFTRCCVRPKTVSSSAAQSSAKAVQKLSVKRDHLRTPVCIGGFPRAVSHRTTVGSVTFGSA